MTDIAAVLRRDPDAVGWADAAGDRALHLAVRSGANMTLIDALLDHGANPAVVNEHGDTCLHLAFAARPVARAQIRQLIRYADRLGDSGARLACAVRNRDGKVAFEMAAFHEADRSWQACLAETWDAYRAWLTANRYDRLEAAIAHGDVAALRAWMRDPAAFSIPLGQGRPALLVAAENGRQEVVRWLMAHAPAAHDQLDDLRDVRTGETALHRAAARGHPDIAADLLSHGAAIDSRDHAGRTSLMLAALHRQNAAFRWLLGMGADVGLRADDDATALMFAVNSHCPDIAETLLQSGAKAWIDACDAQGRTPLMLAVLPVASALLANQLRMIDLLIRSGADIEARVPGGKTALMMAVETQQWSVVVSLLAQGASVHACTSDGWTPTMVAAAGTGEDVMEAVIGAGGDVNRGNAAGATPLIVAVSYGRENLARQLLAGGAEVDGPDNAGRTALSYLAQSHWRDPADAALPRSPFFTAPRHDNDVPAASLGQDEAASRRERLARLLLDHRADPDRADENGMTPLMYAMRAGDAALSRLLLRAGADPQRRNACGLNAGQVAFLSSLLRQLSLNDGDSAGDIQP